MRVTKTIGMGIALAAMLAQATALPAAAQDEAAPDGQPSPQVGESSPPASESGRPDLELDMPTELGGLPSEIVMTRGEEHFVNLGDDAPTRLALEGLLETAGAEVEDMVSGYALVLQDDFYAFVVALRIDGAAPGTVARAYMPILLGGLVEPTSMEEAVAGKDVTVISSLDEDGVSLELYVYDEGDTVWMIQGPLDVVEATIEHLPEPIAEAPGG